MFIVFFKGETFAEQTKWGPGRYEDNRYGAPSQSQGTHQKGGYHSQDAERPFHNRLLRIQDSQQPLLYIPRVCSSRRAFRQNR